MLRFDAENHEYFWNEKQVPCVSNIIDALKSFKIPMKDLDDPKKMAMWIKLWELIKVKRDWGINFHNYTSMYDLKTINEDRSVWDERMIIMVDSWKRFKESHVYINSNSKIVEKKTHAATKKETGVQLSAYLMAAISTQKRGEIKWNVDLNTGMYFCTEQLIYNDQLKYAGTVDYIYGRELSEDTEMIEACFQDNGTFTVNKKHDFAWGRNQFLCRLTNYNSFGV